MANIPCLYTFRGKEYTYNEFRALLADGVLKELKDNKIIDLSEPKKLSAKEKLEDVDRAFEDVRKATQEAIKKLFGGKEDLFENENDLKKFGAGAKELVDLIFDTAKIPLEIAKDVTRLHKFIMEEINKYGVKLNSNDVYNAIEQRVKEKEKPAETNILKENLPKELQDLQGVVGDKEVVQNAKTVLENVAKENQTSIQQASDIYVNSLYDKHFDKNGNVKGGALGLKKIEFSPTTTEKAILGLQKARLEKKITDAVENGFDTLALEGQLEQVNKLISLSETGRVLRLSQQLFKAEGDADVSMAYAQLSRSNPFDFKIPFTEQEFNNLTKAQQELIRPLWEKFNEYKTSTENISKQLTSNLKKYSEEEFNDRLAAELAKKKGISTKPSAIKTAKSGRTIEVIDADIERTKREFQIAMRGGLQSGGVKAVPAFAKLVKLYIEKGITKFKDFYNENKDLFENIKESEVQSAFESQVKEYNREAATGELKKFAEENQVSNITKELAETGLVDEIINSHLGEIDNKDILQKVYEDLKGILPDVTKQEVRDSYIKKGEFKPERKAAKENKLKDTEKGLKKLASKGRRLDELEQEKQNIIKGKLKSKSTKTKTVDAEIETKRKEIKDELNRQGISTETSSEVAREARQKAVEAHNKRVDDLIKSTKKPLLENLKINETDIEKISDKVDRAIKDLEKENTEQSRELASQLKQDIKNAEFKATLDRAMKSLEAKKQKYIRDLAAQKFETPKDKFDLKEDAAYVKANIEKKKAQRVYDDAKIKFEERNAKGIKKAQKRIIELATVHVVSGVLGAGKVAVAAPLKIGADVGVRNTAGRLMVGLGKALNIKLNTERQRLGIKNELRAIKNSIVGANEKQAKKLAEETINNFETYSEQFKSITEKANELKDSYGETSKEYQDFINSNEFKNAKLAFEKANLELGKNLAYSFLSGDIVSDPYSAEAMAKGMQSLKQKVEILKTGSTVFGEAMGDYIRKNKKEAEDAYEKYIYYASAFGRLHAAAKDFSSRQAFLEHWFKGVEKAAENGIELSADEQILLLNRAYEQSGLAGKFQDENVLAKGIRNLQNLIDEYASKNKKNPLGLGAQALSFTTKAGTLVLRIPLNIAKEAVLKYSLGSAYSTLDFFSQRSKFMESLTEQQRKELSGAKNFFKSIKETAENMPTKDADRIAEYFHKGLVGAGLFAYGIYLAYNDELEYNPYTHRISYKGKELNRFTNGLLLHTPFFTPIVLGSIYRKSLSEVEKKGDSAIWKRLKAIEKTLDHVWEELPFDNLISSPPEIFNSLTTIMLTKDISDAIEYIKEGDIAKREPEYKVNFLKGIIQQLMINTGIGKQYAPKKRKKKQIFF